MTFLQIAGSGSTPDQHIAYNNQTTVRVQSYQVISWQGPGTASVNWGSGNNLVCPRQGYYTCSFILQTPSVGQNRQFQGRLLRNGSQVANPGVIEVGDFGSPGMWGVAYNAMFNVGESLQLQGMSWQGQDFDIGTSAAQCVLTFVPTPLYRR